MSSPSDLSAAASPEFDSFNESHISDSPLMDDDIHLDHLDDSRDASIEDLQDDMLSSSTSGSNKRKEVMTLPLPPGALPPRKRAKTKDEKEQRRIERIMRNRQAAHASREKKRRHVEDLEKKCVFLSTENGQLHSQVHQLQSNYSQASNHSKFLRNKLSELVDMITSAQSAGSLASIETAKFLREVDSKTPTATLAPPKLEPVSVPQTTATSPCSLVIDDSDTHSESGLSIPSLSSSVASSPTTSPLDIMIKSEHDDDHVVISLPDEEYSLFGLSDFRSHHPAAMMCM